MSSELRKSVSTYYSPDDMRNSHEMIVNDIRQMIGRMAIRLHENRVFKAVLWTWRLCFSFTFTLPNDSIDKIGVRGWNVRELQSNDMRFTLESTFLRLSSCNAGTSPIIVAR